MLTIPVILLVSVFILGGMLLAYSPGKPEPYLDENGKPLPGSISEKIFVNINGVQQGMIIKSRNIRNPVLIYVHGGMPDYFLTQKYPTGLEDHFTVIWWEQRGSGLSFNPDATKIITSQQLISDTLELTDYLRNRFGKEKIYLMGHSGGTFIGIQAAAHAPELYHAYIGIAQMANQLESERLAYDYMLQRFKETGTTKMVRRLEAAPVTLKDPIPDAYYLLRDGAMHSLGIGTTHDMRSVISGIFLPSLTFREYTVREKFNLWRGKSQSGVSSIWNEITTTDLSMQVTEFEIPVYILAGCYDYTVNYDLQRDYFMKINAPKKGFYTFENSAHSPLFEEPESFIEIMVKDVLNGKVDLADK
ncbi:MAG: alpha/beta hydrolase [Anaerolineaceae bacterium]|nr:alpha/beta hydrolase [Anaerolineaceae bacterium]